MSTPVPPTVLLVEDDEAARSAVATSLTGHGYAVRLAADGEEALRLWELARPDLVLLDLGLPGIDGSAVLRHLRRDAATPVIVLSARDEERQKVEALDAGADDYLTKPFGMAELHARMRAALRRIGAAEPDGTLRVGTLVMDPARRRVTIEGQELRLTPREYEVLKTLLANAGRVVTRGQGRHDQPHPLAPAPGMSSHQAAERLPRSDAVAFSRAACAPTGALGPSRGSRYRSAGARAGSAPAARLHRRRCAGPSGSGDRPRDPPGVPAGRGVS